MMDYQFIKRFPEIFEGNMEAAREDISEVTSRLRDISEKLDLTLLKERKLLLSLKAAKHRQETFQLRLEKIAEKIQAQKNIINQLQA